MSDRLRIVGLPVHECATVRVTATMQTGAALPVWFPAPLDGLLAAAARRRRLGRAYGNVRDHHREDLPLAAIRKDGSLGRTRRMIVWAATCAIPSDQHEDVHWWHGRSLDIIGAREVCGTVPANPEAGPWKAMRIPLVVTVTRTLTWWAIGDPQRIEQLLADVPAVGKKRSQGEGVVLDWEVEIVSDQPDLERICWRDDECPARPLPARYASWLGLDSPDLIDHAVSPPYWRAPQRERDGGGFARSWPQVIAPWVTR